MVGWLVQDFWGEAGCWEGTGVVCILFEITFSSVFFLVGPETAEFLEKGDEGIFRWCFGSGEGGRYGFED